MERIIDRIEALDWSSVTPTLHDRGFVVVKNVINAAECTELADGYEAEDRYRKTINMERYRFGKGEYKYFEYPLPDIITELREAVYARIAPVANTWMKELSIDRQFPAMHADMKKLSQESGQSKPTVLILSYEAGGFNTLHQDLYGEVFFPMQMVFVLDEVNKDYTGGEFVITEQVPRAQSKANVLVPSRGDMVLFFYYEFQTGERK